MRSNTTAALDPASAGEASLLVAAELGLALAEVKTLPELVGILQRRLKWVLPLSRFSFFLRADDGTVAPMLGPPDAMASAPLVAALVDWSIRHDTLLDVPDLEEERWLPSSLRGAGLQHQSGALMILPLHASGAVQGVLTLGATRAHAYAEVDPGLLHLVRSQVASALDRVLLLQQLDGAAEIVTSMARAVEAKDPYTFDHAARVTRYALVLAEVANAPHHVRWVLAHAGPLHDVGKIGVPDALLLKVTPLTPGEFAQIQRHSVIGDEICSPLQSLCGLRPAIRHHHERFDGHGYPDGLAGDQIPLAARILALADAYDAMTSARAYRPAMSVAQAASIIERNDGPQWDPALAQRLVALIRGGVLDAIPAKDGRRGKDDNGECCERRGRPH